MQNPICNITPNEIISLQLEKKEEDQLSSRIRAATAHLLWRDEIVTPRLREEKRRRNKKRKRRIVRKKAACNDPTASLSERIRIRSAWTLLVEESKWFDPARQ